MELSGKLTNIIEGILYVSGDAVAVADIAEKLQVEEKEINKAVEKLKSVKYTAESGIQLLVFNGKLQFATNSKYVEAITSVLNPIKERELSRSLLEVMAIIAYKQPITRGEIEIIRGVDSEYAVSKLLELKLIEPKGRKEAIGRPILLGTTDEFLKRFQISSLGELPDYDELISKITQINDTLFGDAYLYKKDEYVEEPQVTDADIDEFRDFKDEEIPEHLKGEEFDFIGGDDEK